MVYKPAEAKRGYFGIGIFHSKSECNVGTLMRSAHVFGAAFVYTVGKRYVPQAADTTKAWKHIPCYHYATIDDLRSHLPRDCPLVGIELIPTARPLTKYCHFSRSCYLLGAEDHGLTPSALAECTHVVYIPGASHCLNVATAGSLVMYDRISKGQHND